MVSVALDEAFDIGQARTLESVDTLVVVANRKYVRHIPEAAQLIQQPALCAAGILEFVGQEIQELLLIALQQHIALFEGLQYPALHVVEFV